ncbi:DUF4244 domain-containing protein [Cellulomonas rhizosphaerae]|nr:DUF4244 domain-containing protein [Cellulomonas rhizosphaerae]
MRTLLDVRPTMPPTSLSGQVDDARDDPRDDSRDDPRDEPTDEPSDGAGDEPRDGSRGVLRGGPTVVHGELAGGVVAAGIVDRSTHSEATSDDGPGIDERRGAEEPDELHVRRRLRAARPRTDLRPVARGRHLQVVVDRVSRAVQGELREAGMATAEYAIATLAAVGFAGLLVVILKGNEVRGLLMGIVRQALSL